MLKNGLRGRLARCDLRGSASRPATRPDDLLSFAGSPVFGRAGRRRDGVAAKPCREGHGEAAHRVVAVPHRGGTGTCHGRARPSTWRGRVLEGVEGPVGLHWATALPLLCALLAGCATTAPYSGPGPQPQLERGAPVPLVDFVGNVLALPSKLLLWNWRFNSHSISPATEERLVSYLSERDLPALRDTTFRLNQYHPVQDLSRLARNRHVAWPYRLLLGLPMTLAFDVLLPGRVFPWGDYFNPWTNTVHLYSDHTAIALHEAGHAHDVAGRRLKGTYSVARLIPFVDLYQEYQASDEAIGYLQDTGDRTGELSAYKILYPAYGTYMGRYVFPPIGTVVGALLGHVRGRQKAWEKQAFYERCDGT